MTLNLAALTNEIETMSETLIQMDQARCSLLQVAQERLNVYALALDEIEEKVQFTRDRNLHWRGAYPAGDDPLNARFPRPEMPPRVNVIANDGSQVPIDHHAAVIYYAINIGYIIYPYGTDEHPIVNTDPSLHFRDKDLFSGDQFISNAIVNSRRTWREIENLANLAIAYAQKDSPVVILSDGPLMWVQPGDTPKERRDNLKPYLKSFDRLKISAVAVGGYVDRPRSTGLLSLLHLMNLEKITSERLAQHDSVGLTDAHLFSALLEPGERSTVLVRQSPTNRDYKDLGHEIWHFYMNVSDDPTQPLIARIEMPAWAIQDPFQLDLLHATVWQQCQIIGGYPYVLARAHELALISTDERRSLEEIIIGALRRQGSDARSSRKAWYKSLTGGKRRKFR